MYNLIRPSESAGPGYFLFQLLSRARIDELTDIEVQ
jgi:hypothetical protein